MDSLTLPENAYLRLIVEISSEAIVATNVSINDKIFKKSIQYKFSADLGLLSELEKKELSVVSSFFTSPEILDSIMNNTIVTSKLLYNGNDVELPVQKEKISTNFFIYYSAIELKF